MLKVGLTGSIAVGKTYVAGVLNELGCPILDADLVARKVVEPHTEGWQQIVESFGDEVLNADQTLNRAKLGSIVFANEQKRLTLNLIVHPLVFIEQNNWLQTQNHQGAKIAVIDAALMIESGGYKKFDKIIVVWCQPEIQLKRLITRNGLTRQEALLRINAQMSQDEKKSCADFLIDSTNGFADTRQKVKELYQLLLKQGNS